MRSSSKKVTVRQFPRGYIVGGNKPLPQGVKKEEYKLDLVEAFYDVLEYNDCTYLIRLMDDAKKKNVIINNFSSVSSSIVFLTDRYKIRFLVDHGEIQIKIGCYKISMSSKDLIIPEKLNKNHQLVFFVKNLFKEINHLYE